LSTRTCSTAGHSNGDDRRRARSDPRDGRRAASILSVELGVTVVLSAIAPTVIAERWFLPDAAAEEHAERPSAPVPAEEFV
jgi:regulator of extracellular matrix RemA (YlzA/DUF370 family)